jgi:hypothetical protein
MAAVTEHDTAAPAVGRSMYGIAQDVVERRVRFDE